VKLFEILKVAIAAIWAHKLRSALTLLGMIVGVTAFVTVVSLIQGFNVYIDEKIAGIGAKAFSVQRFNPFEDFKDTDTIAAAQRRNKELTMQDYDFIKERSALIAKLGAKARGTPSQIKRNDQVLDDVFVNGATAAAIGTIAGSVIVLGRRSVIDLPTLLIALATAAALWKFKKVPEPVIVVAAAVLGLVIYPLATHA